jgi:hypothetical protein
MFGCYDRRCHRSCIGLRSRRFVGCVLRGRNSCNASRPDTLCPCLLHNEHAIVPWYIRDRALESCRFSCWHVGQWMSGDDLLDKVHRLMDVDSPGRRAATHAFDPAPPCASRRWPIPSALRQVTPRACGRPGRGPPSVCATPGAPARRRGTGRAPGTARPSDRRARGAPARPARWSP